MRPRISPQVADPKLSFSSDRLLAFPCARALKTDASRDELSGIRRAEVPSVGVPGGDADPLRAPAADNEPWRLDVDGPEARARQTERIVGHVLSPPQCGQRSAARLEASHPVRERGKRDRERLVVVARQSERSGAETDVQTASARGLGHCELPSEEEGVTEADVEDTDGHGDPLRASGHRGKEGRRVPRGSRSRRARDVIEAGEEPEPLLLGGLPRGCELLEGPSPLPGLHADTHEAPAYPCTVGRRSRHGLEFADRSHVPTRYIACVGGVSKQEVADRAGVDLDRVDELIALGILVPDGDGSMTAGDVRRARLVEGLVRAGLPVRSLAEATAGGDLSFAFFDLPVYDRFAQLSGTTFREIGERDGISVELLLLIREAIGFARPQPEDRMREDELRIVPLIRLQLANGFDPTVIERWLRVYGESLRRIAETETAWWRSEIEAPRLASGMNEAEMLEAAAGWGEEIASLTEQALLEIYHGQQEHTWTENFVEDVENALDRAGLRRRADQLPAMCFLDITGYTRLTEERGDEAAAELAAGLARLVQRASDRHRGKIVKWSGDGVMLHFRDPGSAVRCALEMIDEVTSSGLPPAHVGIHAGSVVFQGGDYFGRTVNVASRIADYARPGEVLVSQEVVDASDLWDVELNSIGPVELKGVSDPLRLHAVRRRT